MNEVHILDMDNWVNRYGVHIAFLFSHSYILIVHHSTSCVCVYVCVCV